MIANVAKWGNSLALRIPSAYAREIALSDGAAVDVSLVDGAIVIRPVAFPEVFDLDELLAAVTEENRHDEIATGGSVGAEF
ncbi:MAG: AbrB/MazE/SpoVT family DNA-binding domain-containing protein [Salinarimonadaceae bacterium]|nr:MAG: AbrB/MazE/SpoVT family DNA-binding domain-containing protein [Salinarimonadaceae bacterium]